MIRFLQRLTLFSVCASGAYILFIVLAGILLPSALRKNLVYTYGGNGFADRRLAEADTTTNIDLLFIGSSRAYRGFDTRLFTAVGYRCFNLGSSNQTPVQSLALLKRYWVSMKPKMVIMEVNPDICSNDGVESAIDLVSNAPNFHDQWAYALSSPDIRVVNTLIFSFAAKAVGIHARLANPPGGQKYISGGFVETEQKPYDASSGNDYVCDVSKKQLTALGEIARLVQQRGSKLWLVQAPVDPGLYGECHQNTLFDSLMITTGEYENFNHSEKFVFPDHFADGQHLNASGVDVLNRLLLQKIESRVR